LFQFKIKAWGSVPNAKADTIAPEAPRGLIFFQDGIFIKVPLTIHAMSF